MKTYAFYLVGLFASSPRELWMTGPLLWQTTSSLGRHYNTSDKVLESSATDLHFLPLECWDAAVCRFTILVCRLNVDNISVLLFQNFSLMSYAIILSKIKRIDKFTVLITVHDTEKVKYVNTYKNIQLQIIIIFFSVQYQP